MSADGASTAERPDAHGILDDVLGIIGEDVIRIRALVNQTERVLTGEEARNLSGYARALVDVAKARKAAEDDPLTPEELERLELLENDPRVKELLQGRK